MTILQGSPEWLALRVGKITSSRIADVMAKGKGSEPSAIREKYRAQIVAERLTGESQEDTYESEAMTRGREQEPFARIAYEVNTNTMVEQVAFVDHPTIPRFGGSPDGLVGTDGGAEIKCPNTATHIRWMIAGKVPDQHRKQMLALLSCTGRDWWDFVSYDSRLDPDLALFVRRLHRHPTEIAEMEEAVQIFDAACEATVEAIRKRELL